MMPSAPARQLLHASDDTAPAIMCSGDIHSRLMSAVGTLRNYLAKALPAVLNCGTVLIAVAILNCVSRRISTKQSSVGPSYVSKNARNHKVDYRQMWWKGSHRSPLCLESSF